MSVLFCAFKLTPLYLLSPVFTFVLPLPRAVDVSCDYWDLELQARVIAAQAFHGRVSTS